MGEMMGTTCNGSQPQTKAGPGKGRKKAQHHGHHKKGNVIDDIPLWTLAWTYWGFIYAILTAHMRRFLFWICALLGYLKEDPAFLSAEVRTSSSVVLLGNNKKKRFVRFLSENYDFLISRSIY